MMLAKRVIPSISEKEIAAFSTYILRISGIYLDKSKGYLLEARLKGLMDACEVTSYSHLLDKIRADSSKKLELKLVDAISTNETFFFRDHVPFDLLRNKIIPDLIDLRRKYNPSGSIPIRIWSAACSTGQEVYSIAITLLETLSGRGAFEIFILGTDISDQAVAKASYGKYSRFEIERGLPEKKRLQYFTQSGDAWCIKDEVRALARFERINLMNPFPASVGPFDIVFCRNVALYFQNHDKINLFKKIAKVISPGGSLIVGGSENLMSIAPDFEAQHYLRGIYFTLKTPVSPSGKTVYEKKQPRPAIKVERLSPEKKSPPLKRVDSSSSISSIQKTGALQSPSPLVEQLVKDKATPKISLLHSMQGSRKHNPSLLTRKRKAKDSKASLLEKINSQKEQ